MLVLPSSVLMQCYCVAVYLKKLPSCRYPSSGPGWSESLEDLSNLPWRLRGGRERREETWINMKRRAGGKDKDKKQGGRSSLRRGIKKRQRWMKEKKGRRWSRA